MNCLVCVPLAVLNTQAAPAPFRLHTPGGANQLYEGEPLGLANKHGGDWTEWPDPWQVRELPEAFRTLKLRERKMRL